MRTTTTEVELAKIVIHTREGKLLKGYSRDHGAVSDEIISGGAPLPCTDKISIQLQGSGELVEVDCASLKALYFVKTFEGNSAHNEVKFFEAHPPVEGLWVRLCFFDGECIEGVIHNSIKMLTEPGFFLKPPDPNSNNRIMYVFRTSLREFRVLGVKSSF